MLPFPFGMGRAFLDGTAPWMGTKRHGQDKSVGMAWDAGLLLGHSLGVHTQPVQTPKSSWKLSPPRWRCPKWLWDVYKNHWGFELNLCIGGSWLERRSLWRDWSEPGIEGEVRPDGSRAAAPSMPVADWDSHPPREEKGCSKAANPTLLRSPLYGIEVTKTFSTCEVQPLKSVYLPQSTDTSDTFLDGPCRCYQLLSQHCH